MRILLTNDDGVKAIGIKVLFDTLSKCHDVTMIAPLKPANAASRSLSLGRGLKIKRLNPNIIAVNGTPADCVILGLYNLLPKPPELIISGINSKPNLGEDVSYSGTVGGAMEGASVGIPAIALSLYEGKNPDFNSAVTFTFSLIEKVQKRGWIAPGITLNVNIPDKPKGVQVTKLGRREYHDIVNEYRGGYVIGGIRADILESGTDITAFKEGYISVTPIHSDLTSYGTIETLKKLF